MCLFWPKISLAIPQFCTASIQAFVLSRFTIALILVMTWFKMSLLQRFKTDLDHMDKRLLFICSESFLFSLKTEPLLLLSADTNNIYSSLFRGLNSVGSFWLVAPVDLRCLLISHKQTQYKEALNY